VFIVDAVVLAVLAIVVKHLMISAPLPPASSPAPEEI
jgi:hypothetical protein